MQENIGPQHPPPPPPPPPPQKSSHSFENQKTVKKSGK